jgi:hypothetical protein
MSVIQLCQARKKRNNEQEGVAPCDGAATDGR